MRYYPLHVLTGSAPRAAVEYKAQEAEVGYCHHNLREHRLWAALLCGVLAAEEGRRLSQPLLEGLCLDKAVESCMAGSGKSYSTASCKSYLWCDAQQAATCSVLQQSNLCVCWQTAPQTGDQPVAWRTLSAGSDAPRGLPACRGDAAVLRQASCAPVHVLLCLRARCRHLHYCSRSRAADKEREPACTLRVHMRSTHAHHSTSSACKLRAATLHTYSC